MDWNAYVDMAVVIGGIVPWVSDLIFERVKALVRLRGSLSWSLWVTNAFEERGKFNSEEVGGGGHCG